ncbi:MAG: aminotransferase class III-fold pyridoxal phosphate-dependent enzyme, partial [Acidobacteriota bacterium]
MSENHSSQSPHDPLADAQGPAAAISPPETRRSLALARLRETLAELLRLEVAAVDVDAPFLEMGADSILLVEAVRVVEHRFGVKTSIRQFFEELTTIRALADFVAASAPQGAFEEAEPPVSESPLAGPANASPPPSASAEKAETLGELPVQARAPEAPAHKASAPQTLAFKTPAPEASSLESASLAAVASPLPAPAYEVQGANSALGVLLQQQLQIMSQQLQLMGGASRPVEVQQAQDSPRPARPATSAAAPEPPAAEPRAVEPRAVEPRAVEPRAVEPAAQASPLPPWKPSSTRAAALDARQSSHLEALVRRGEERRGRSKIWAQRHRSSLADNRATAGFRPSTKELLYPLVGQRSDGARVIDVDGNSYIDITMGFGVHLFGHRPAFVQRALEAQLGDGTQLGPQAEPSGLVAEKIAAMVGLERVTFLNSGTEAVMTAMRLARAAKGRRKIAIFSGAYHGHFDGVLGVRGGGEGSVLPMAPGVTDGMVQDLLVLDYGADSALETLKHHAGEVAAVMVEPVQSRRPDLQPRDFLHRLRRLTSDLDIALIFDEMITGFRVHPGGAQAHFGVRADLACYGKVIGGGMPIGVVAGSAELMDGIDGGAWRYGDSSFPGVETTFVAGTFSKHPLTMAAALAVASELEAAGPALQEELNARTEDLCRRLDALFEAEEVPIRTACFSSLFRFVFQGNMDLFFYHLLDEGIYVWEGRNCFL